MPTINDIAETLSLSRQTVSQILRNPENPSYPPKTRSRVLAAAKRLHYVPNVMARGLAQGRTHLLSLILPFNIPELMDTAQRVAREAGYGLMMQFTPSPVPDIERTELLAALERQVDGILWMPCSGRTLRDNPEIGAQLKRSDTPVVFLETAVKGVPMAATVRPDYAAGTELMVRHLIAQGYRRIVYACHYDEMFDRDRVADFRRMAAAAGVAADVLRLESDSKAGKSVAACVQAGERPMAFYCMGDIAALDVMNAARSEGLSVPEDVGVAALGDILLFGRTRLGDLVRPSLTAVSQPFGEMARQAVRLLADKQQYAAAVGGGGVRVPVELVPRESTARLQ